MMQSGSVRDDEHEEFGLEDIDPIEQVPRVQTHTDFTFIDPFASNQLAQATSISLFSIPQTLLSKVSKSDKTTLPTWFRNLPAIDGVSDQSQWRILEIKIRPDRSWDVLKDLLATICIGKGLILIKEKPKSLYFRKQVGNKLYQNLFLSIGVIPSKLRVLHLAYIISMEQNPMLNMLANGMNSMSLSTPLAQESEKAKWLLNCESIAAAVQSALLTQRFNLASLYTSESEDEAKLNNGEMESLLDSGYVEDVRRMFLVEMKTNMREVTIPLEEFAYKQEYGCALLLGLLDPTLKKLEIQLSSSNAMNIDIREQRRASSIIVEEEEASFTTPVSIDHAEMKCYSERVTEAAQELWIQLEMECKAKITAKISEKQNQVTLRSEAAQKLRREAIEAIANSTSATKSQMRLALESDRVLGRDDVLFYETSCGINNTPVKLQVTYGYLIYRSVVPFFNTITVVKFSTTKSVQLVSAVGLRTLVVELVENTTSNIQSSNNKQLTIVMGLEIELLYHLLLELVKIHQVDTEISSQFNEDTNGVIN